MSKKKQHFVPKFYLNSFTVKPQGSRGDAYLWVFKKYETSAYKKSPKNIGFVKYFYTSDPEFGDPDEIENILMQMEGKVSKSYRRIVQDPSNIAEKDKAIFCRFTCFMRFRTPQSREHMRILIQNGLKQALVDEINSKGFESFVKEHENERESITKESFLETFNGMKLNLSNDQFIVHMIEQAQKMILPLFERNWSILKAPHSSCFATNDNPVVMFDQNNKDSAFIHGIGMSNTDVVFPLTPSLCLYASFGVNNEVKEIGPTDVYHLNKIIANNCQGFVFANTNDFKLLFG